MGTLMPHFIAVLTIRLRLFLTLAFAAFATGCAPEAILINHGKGGGGESDTFGYRTWKRKGVEPDVVVIGIHGFCGASVDYANLGNHLVQRQPKTALYAYEVRGQGSDPIYTRRGDIGDPVQWYDDLEAFTQLVEERHPDAKIIWYGESMGALIATHALNAAPPGKLPCDGLVLSSPIVRFKDDLEPWKIALVRAAATTLPLARVSLDALAPEQDVQMTQESKHLTQAKMNSYHVEKYTLRLLDTLGRLIEGMNGCAADMKTPVLVLHGGKDYFNDDSDMRGFISRIPSGVPKTYKNYPDAYHLLMYDDERSRIFGDVERWLNKRRRD